MELKAVATSGLGGVILVHWMWVAAYQPTVERIDLPPLAAVSVSSSLAGGAVAVNAITDESYSIPAAHMLKIALK